MGCPVEKLLRSISSAELTEWMAYYRIEPWGTDVDDLRAGVVASTIANVNRDPKKRRKPYKAEDFMPKWGSAGSQVEEQSPEDQFKIILMMQAALDQKFK